MHLSPCSREQTSRGLQKYRAIGRYSYDSSILHKANRIKMLIRGIKNQRRPKASLELIPVN
jgi:hypothetical protein